MRIPARLVLGLLTAVVVVALVAFAAVLVDAQESARTEIEDRFRERANASAELTASLFESASATAAGNNAARFGGPTVSAEALGRRAAESNNRYLLVLDDRGEVLAASPGTPDRVLADIAERPSHIRAVLEGRPFSLSDLQRPDSGPPEIMFSQPFPTPLGRRVLVSGLDGRFIGEFLAGSLRRLPKVPGGRQYVVDSRGVIIGTPSPDQRAGALPTEPGLAAALRTSSMGRLRSSDRRFVAQRITGTPWRVVRTAPRDELFSSVQGVNRWGPWLLFAAFALAAGAVIVLVRSVLRRAEDMADVNVRLAESNANLEDRARDLARANRQLGWTNAELGRSNEELERFASIASHDLQEPLRKVRMFSERIAHHEGEGLSDRSRDYLDRMSSAAHRMQDLIDGLLQYSRVTMQTTPPEDVDLERVAHEVVGDLEVTIRDAGARVEIGTLPHISADPLQMRQLLQNLIANGLKFRRPDVTPEVRVQGRALDDTVEITVSDNGIGVEERYAERIFNVFERLHPRTAYPGTGMGLALCRRIAERHHGSISVESVPGEGSTFTVSLPLRPDDRHAVPASADRRKKEEHVPRADHPSPVLILMADDDEEDRELTREALAEARLSNELRCVADGVELMDYLRREGEYAAGGRDATRPGIILLDLNMPRMDGREALAEIKADPALRHIPVVVLTTSKAEEDIVRTYELGVNSFITKPVTFDGLVEVVRGFSRYWFEIVDLPTG